MAVGLGSMDMPIPQVAAWEWVNWKFPKPVKAGETIYARWTLTQKRPPVHGAPTGITVWRVDVHTADGAVCAEGEVGASVFRRSVPGADRAAEPGTPVRRRRRRRASASAETTPPPAAAPQPAPAERSGSARRRRRRRPSGSSSGNGEPAAATQPPEPPAAAPPPQAVAVASASAANPLSRVMRRLRRT